VGNPIATFVTVAIVALWLGVSTVQAQTADDLFGSQELQRIDLWVNSADWAKLQVDFQVNTYYPADVVWSGQTVRNVGIRSRGRGSRSANKPGLRVDFDHYATGQKFLGLKSFVLDNLTQDPSGIHETVATGFYARLGIPVSREIHTRLYVNNQYAGLYAIVEAVDKDLLARVFGSIDGNVQNDGYLYEFKYQDDYMFILRVHTTRCFQVHIHHKMHTSSYYKMFTRLHTTRCFQVHIYYKMHTSSYHKMFTRFHITRCFQVHMPRGFQVT
jgi:spore coat protein CotH